MFLYFVEGDHACIRHFNSLGSETRPIALRQVAADIAWETEVRIADDPDHKIHFDDWIKFYSL